MWRWVSINNTDGGGLPGLLDEHRTVSIEQCQHKHERDKNWHMKNPNMTSEANNYGPFAALPSVSSPLLPEMLDPLLFFHLLPFGTEDMIRESPETLKQAFQQ